MLFIVSSCYQSWLFFPKKELKKFEKWLSFLSWCPTKKKSQFIDTYYISTYCCFWNHGKWVGIWGLYGTKYVHFWAKSFIITLSWNSMQNMSKDELGTFSQKMQLNIVLLGPDHLELILGKPISFISYWVDFSKCYLIMSKLLLSNVRFLALFRGLEESTHWKIIKYRNSVSKGILW